MDSQQTLNHAVDTAEYSSFKKKPWQSPVIEIMPIDETQEGVVANEDGPQLDTS